MQSRTPKEALVSNPVSRRQLIARGLQACALSALPFPVSAAAAGRRPNFIVIYCDDLGYGDISPFGGTAIRTPHMERMARRGLALTDYYAPANLCTPSRAGFMTGRYPIRTGLAEGVILRNDTRGLPLSEVTIAEALRPAYTSALIGKWHLGHNAPSWPPTRHGFDLFYGIPYSHDMLPLDVYEGRGDTLEKRPFTYPELQQQFWRRAERFIEDHRNTPFFLNLALSAPHLPNFPQEAYAGKSDAGAYGDAVEEIDGIVGKLMDKLDRLGLTENTLVILTSDNGPWFEGSSGGFRERKGGGAYDGGYRVPCIAYQPGSVPPGLRSNAIAMGIDFLPTFCAMAGLDKPGGVELDGLDITGTLYSGRGSPHEELLLFNDDEVVGIRTQRWKFVDAAYYRGRLFSLEGRGYPQLYDMTGDTGESYSVAARHPELVAEFRQRMDAARTRFAPLRTSSKSGIFMPPGERPELHLPEMWQD